jgi:four helix bundle protein
MIKSVSDLEIFNLACSFAGEIFQISRHFPKEEKYSLTDQIVRASRSIAANIAEGWAKRVYENEFKKHLVYSMGSLEESKVWLLFAKNCGYFSDEAYNTLFLKSEQLGSKIYKLYENWKTL